MTQIMTATAMTDGQIENAVGKLRDAMRKHRSGIASDVAQQILGVENLGMVLFAPFRERAELLSTFVIRTVTVDRNRSPQAALDATSRKQYTDRKVVDAMPKGEGEQAEVVFFKPDLSDRDDYISDDNLEKEFELRGLKPADPISVAAVNEADPTFADERPHGTHWKDSDQNYCFAAFDRWVGGRDVSVGQYSNVWGDLWWFAGVRK